MDGLDRWKKEVEDALAVMGGLQARQGRVLADHAEWLQTHDRVMAEAAEREARIDARIEALVAAGKVTDERIEKLVPAIGEFIRQSK